MTSCSWCHTLNPLTMATWRSCGHLAHVPRAACTCPICDWHATEPEEPDELLGHPGHPDSYGDR